MKTGCIKYFILIAMALAVVAWPVKAHAAASQLRITEIMYDPNGNGDREFIELYNGSDSTASLGGITMFGVDFTFSAGTTLGSGSYAVIVRNLASFRAAHPSSRVFGQYGGKLQGSGESVRLISNGATVSQVDYRFGGAWPSGPRNGGPSLSLIRPNANESNASCWLASSASGGSPGLANGVASSTRSGCDSKDYPSTPRAVPAAASTNTAAKASATAAPAAGGSKPVEANANKTDTKVAAKATAKAQSPAVTSQQGSTSRTNLVGAIVLVALSSIVGVGLVVWQRLQRRRAYKKVAKPKRPRKRRAK